jgi:hypothetical protein
MTNVSVEFRGALHYYPGPDSAEHKPDRGAKTGRRLLRMVLEERAATVRAEE